MHIMSDESKKFWGAIGSVIAIIVAIALAAVCLDVVKFADDVPTAAIKALTSLLILTIFIERGLAIINAILHGKDRRQHEHKLRMVSLARQLRVIDPDSAFKIIEHAFDKLKDIADKEEKVRIFVVIPVALFVSAFGVRTMSALMSIDAVKISFQKYVLHAADIVLTASLIAGGSNGIAQLLQLIKDAINPPSKP
jgi:hypothetical protein